MEQKTHKVASLARCDRSCFELCQGFTAFQAKAPWERRPCPCLAYPYR